MSFSSGLHHLMLSYVLKKFWSFGIKKLLICKFLSPEALSCNSYKHLKFKLMEMK